MAWYDGIVAALSGRQKLPVAPQPVQAQVPPAKPMVPRSSFIPYGDVDAGFSRSGSTMPIAPPGAKNTAEIAYDVGKGTVKFLAPKTYERVKTANKTGTTGQQVLAGASIIPGVVQEALIQPATRSLTSILLDAGRRVDQEAPVVPNGTLARLVFGEEPIQPIHKIIEGGADTGADLAEKLGPQVNVPGTDKKFSDYLSPSSLRALGLVLGGTVAGGGEALNLLPGGEGAAAKKVGGELVEKGVKKLITEGGEQILKEGGEDILSGLVKKKAAGEVGEQLLKKADDLLPAAEEVAEKVLKPDEGSVLKEVEKIFSPPAKPKFVDRVGDFVRNIQTRVVSEFTPVREAEKSILKTAGLGKPKLDMARRFELVAGASGKADADLREFADAVVSKIPKDMEKDFNSYLFLERTKQRLIEDPDLKKVGSWTPEKVQRGIDELREKVGEDSLNLLESIAKGPYQQQMDRGLQLQVQSGRLSKEVYLAIKESNDFYAPFKVMKYLEEGGSVGRRIDSMQDLTKAIKGIRDEDLSLQDIIQSSAQQLYKSRILAENNEAMKAFGKLADIGDGTIVKRTGYGAKAEPGFEIVKYFDEGVEKTLQVKRDVAAAIQGLNKTQQKTILQTAASGAGSLLRAGATTFNAGFQTVNLFAADLPRAAILSKYGLRKPEDLLRFPADFVHSLFSSMLGNFGAERSSVGKLLGADKLYDDFLRSGAARSTIQRELTPEAFKQALKVKESFSLKSLVTALKPSELKKATLDNVARFANAIEETSKVMGIKRGKRFEGIDKLPIKEQIKRMQEIASEVRNFSGSPDFARHGTDGQSLNLLFNFFNARLQGQVGDLARLAGKTGGKEAGAAWARLGTVIGVPTATLFLLNQRPGYKEDYERLSETDRQNYFHIPKSNFIKDVNGDSVRDYWRIPKREVVQTFSNLIEAGLDFAKTKDANGLAKFGESFLEGLSPISIRGDNISERIESVGASLNPVLKVPIEFGSGRDMFHHSNTVPRGAEGRSPENQYSATTPDFYKKLGALTDQSPLKLQQAVRGLTAGGVNQFIPAKPVEGRGDLANNPVLQGLGLGRFQRSLRSNDDAFWEENQLAKQKEEDESFFFRQSAEKKFEDLSKLPESEANDQLMKVYEENRPLYDKILEVADEKEKGITSKDRAYTSHNIEGGARANFLMQQLDKLKDEEKNAKLEDLYNKKIVTDQVLDQIQARKLLKELEVMPVEKRDPYLEKLYTDGELTNSVFEELAKIANPTPPPSP